VRLPSHVDAEKIEAGFTAGVLTVRVPKSASALPPKITIKNTLDQRHIPAK
jgi:HSP20 family molecular chaperone IbpA